MIVRGQTTIIWPCGLMDKALVFGATGCRLESCQGHVLANRAIWLVAMPGGQFLSDCQWQITVSWPCGLMDKALVFGTKDCRLESCQGHALANRMRKALGSISSVSMHNKPASGV